MVIILKPLCVALAIFAAATVSATDLRVDFAKRQGGFRALHGVNGGPLNQGGTVDVSQQWQELAVPVTRLHDCEWPAGRVADMHSVFPSLTADPAKADSYRHHSAL